MGPTFIYYSKQKGGHMSTDFQYFQSFLFTNRRCLEYVTDKSKSSESIICYMLSRLQKMFKYSNLPDTIPRQYLENYLLVNGSCVIGKDLMHPEDENLYAFVGAAGGVPDIYYRPTFYIISNPALHTTCQYFISETDPEHEPNGVLIRNDTMWQGLYPMMARYASLISENLLTLRTADIMLRVLALITAPDDSSRLAADQFLSDITNGKLASVAENRFLDGIRMQNPPSNNGSYLTQFIELHQYLVGSFYNEVGLNANYNMKREALSESETGLNDDSLMPLCEDMLRCRREDMEKVNAMFGTSIQVDFDSSWLENTIERLLSLRQQASEASSQLVNPAPMEAGMESVGLEDASEEGVSNQSDDGFEESGNDEEGSVEDGSREDDGSEDDGGNDESESIQEEGSNGNSEDDAVESTDETSESEQGVTEEDGGEEPDVDSNEAPEVEVNVRVEVVDNSDVEDSTEEDGREEDGAEEDGTEESEKEVDEDEDKETKD